MSKDTGELIIIKKSINLCSQPIFSYIYLEFGYCAKWPCYVRTYI